MFWWNSHDFRDNIWHFCDNESHPGQPRPPIVCENFVFFVFFCFLDGFAMVLGRGLWFFLFFFGFLRLLVICGMSPHDTPIWDANVVLLSLSFADYVCG